MSNLFGDWNKVNRFMRTMNPRFVAAMSKATSDNLALAERTVVHHLRNQDLRWKRLNRDYLKRKRRLGLSEKTLIATGTYFKNITSVKDSPFEGAVGVLRTAKNRKGGSVANLAKVHEFGTRNKRIPKRPLWEPSTEEIADEALRNYDKAMARVVYG